MQKYHIFLKTKLYLLSLIVALFFIADFAIEPYPESEPESGGEPESGPYPEFEAEPESWPYPESEPESGAEHESGA